MHQILAIMYKDLLQWTRRPLYFISTTLLGVLILLAVGNTLSGSTHLHLGLYDPDRLSPLSQQLVQTKRFVVHDYDNINQGKTDLAAGRISALVDVSQDPIEDKIRVWTEGHNLLVNQQMAMGLFGALAQGGKSGDIPLQSRSLFPVSFGLRDYITPGLAAYLCYVIACMNIGFAWIYEWMEKTYNRIALAPFGVSAAIVAKTFTVMAESSVVLALALSITSPLAGFTLGTNLPALAGIVVLSMFCFTCIGLTVGCFLRSIRIYTMFISIFGVALMFVSGIVVPVEAMPQWEKIIALAMPMYYSADALKGAMLGIPASYLRDVLIMVAWSAATLLLSTLLLTKRKVIV